MEVSPLQRKILEKAYLNGYVVWKDFYKTYSSRSSAFRGLKTMVAKRLLKPVPDPHQNGRVLYRITPLGKALFLYLKALR